MTGTDVGQIRDRYGTDDLSHGLATLTAKEKDGTDGTDVFFKKEFEKRMEIHTCRKAHVCMRVKRL